MDFTDNFNNSYSTDVDIDTNNKYNDNLNNDNLYNDNLYTNNKYIDNLDSKSNKSKKNTIQSDTKSITRTITPYNSNGDILWIQTPYTNIDSPNIDYHNTNLNHDEPFFNIFNYFSICNWYHYSFPDCNCPGL